MISLREKKGKRNWKNENERITEKLTGVVCCVYITTFASIKRKALTLLIKGQPLGLPCLSSLSLPAASGGADCRFDVVLKWRGLLSKHVRLSVSTSLASVSVIVCENRHKSYPQNRYLSRGMCERTEKHVVLCYSSLPPLLSACCGRYVFCVSGW